MYGKGGIGKSTLAANLSAALAEAGLRVLQIGCDPKQDSTRLLLHGKTIGSVLDYQRRTPPEARRLKAIVHGGYAGVSCVEAGGPEPGVGCAGRGILSTFDLLEQLGIERLHHDIILYDVLGDVVCGGFAVPLRQDYAETVFIVTSGELMSLYAANNILRGIRNYEGQGPRVGGILFNERKLENEEERVEHFAQAVGLPIVARFSRNRLFAEAEALGRTIVESFPETELARRFHDLAAYVAKDAPRFRALPVPPDELERVVRGQGSVRVIPKDAELGCELKPFPVPYGRILPAGRIEGPPSLPLPPSKRYCSKGVRTHSVLFGCAFNGTVHTLTQIRDASTLVHGPRSCAFLSSQGLVAAARRLRDQYGARFEEKVPPIHCSQMDEHTVIFGGNGALEDALRRVVNVCPKLLCVVTTCAPGIIGDDARLVVKTFQHDDEACRVLLFPSDGVITGDYMQGVLDAMRIVAEELIDPHLERDENAVNIIAEKNLATNTEENFLTIQDLLKSLGIRINCRFIRRTTTDEIASFKRGSLNLLAFDDSMGRAVRDFLTDRFHARFAVSPFPVGFRATVEWLWEIAEHFRRLDEAEKTIERHTSIYRAWIDKLRPELQGKRVFIAAQNHRIDWVLEAALELGMEVLKVGILESTWDDLFLSRYQGRVPIAYPYPRDQRQEDIRALNPDLVLINYPWRTLPETVRWDHIPVCPDVGFFSGIKAAARWARLLNVPAKEGWRRDV